MAWDPDEWTDHVNVHGILLLLGWGFFIPVSVLTNSHLYRRQSQYHKLGVHFHMAMGMIGFVLAVAGFSYGCRHLTTFSRDNVDEFNMAHAVIGTIATAGMILELLLMAIMRPPKYDHESYTNWPWWQKLGHFSHRGLGFLWLFLGFVALETGTHLASVRHPRYTHLADQNEKWSGALLATIFAAIVSVTLSVQMIIRLTPAEQDEPLAPQDKNIGESEEECEEVGGVEAQPTNDPKTNESAVGEV